MKNEKNERGRLTQVNTPADYLLEMLMHQALDLIIEDFDYVHRALEEGEDYYLFMDVNEGTPSFATGTIDDLLEGDFVIIPLMDKELRHQLMTQYTQKKIQDRLGWMDYLLDFRYPSMLFNAFKRLLTKEDDDE